jgi:hypothetical protein
MKKNKEKNSKRESWTFLKSENNKVFKEYREFFEKARVLHLFL